MADADTCSNRSSSSNTVLGFDIEWRPNFARGGGQNKVALVQLATAESALLIQMKFAGSGKGDHVPPDVAKKRMIATLTRVLNSDHIVKVGVGIAEDLVKLERDFGVSFRNFVDLGLASKRHVYWSMLTRNQAPSSSPSSFSPTRLSAVTAAAVAAATVSSQQSEVVGTVDGDQGRCACCAGGVCVSDTLGRQHELMMPLPKSGLASLVQRFLGISIPKPRSVRTSNWELLQLSDPQVTYAAYDALYGRLVYDRLHAMGAFCRREQRRFVDHVFAEEIARVSMLDTGTAGTATATEATGLVMGGDVDDLLPGADPCSGGLARASFRRIGLLSVESDWLLDEFGSRVQRVDLAWLQSMEEDTTTHTNNSSSGGGNSSSNSSNSSSSHSSIHSSSHSSSSSSSVSSSSTGKDTKNIWRHALLCYLSRMGCTLRLDTVTRARACTSGSSRGSGSSSGSNSGSSIGGGRGGGPIPADNRVSVAVVVNGRILAEGRGASKAIAAESACRLAVYELVTVVQTRVSPADTITYFAGRHEGVHVAFSNFLDSKIPYDKSTLTTF